MIAGKSEVMLNSPEQVRTYLQAALMLVEELEPPDSLLEACFLKAVELTSAKHVQLEQAAPVALDGRLLRGH